MTYRVPESGLVKRRKKMIYWYMPLFLLCFHSSFFTTFFFFILSFFLLVLLLLVSCYSLTMGSSFHLWLPLPFIVNWFNEISPFCPKGFTNHFWFLVGIPSGLPTTSLVAQPLSLFRVCLLHHSLFLEKTLLCFVSPLTFPALPKWIRAWAPFSTCLYGMH